jgi:hypothetical protein
MKLKTLRAEPEIVGSRLEEERVPETSVGGGVDGVFDVEGMKAAIATMQRS